MSVEYKYRQYRDGDAAAINHLYDEISGRPRSKKQFEWQWLDAPGGKGDIWLIEAVSDDGETKLIGHHGIMPIRFSRGNEDLLFGKTENTMVLPEYRSKILYPRFERRFAKVYEDRFDALFSTFGPVAAIRQRRAMGYTFPSKWVHVRVPTSGAGNITFIYRTLRSRIGLKEKAGSDLVRRSPANATATTRTSPLELRALDDAQARVEPFFDSFWSDCRSEYGLTPRRDKEDLDWRFWSNPNTSYVTLISEKVSGEPGYVIVRTSNSSLDTASIEDIVPSAPSAKKFGRLLDSALGWMKVNGYRWVDLSVTSDACADGRIAAGIERRNLLLLQARSRLRPAPDQFMPRKITASGKSKNVGLDDWYVTPIIFEGL